MRILRGIYEGPGSHGVLRVTSGMERVHTITRSAPGEAYFPTFYASRERNGIAPAVSLSPLWRKSEDTSSPGDLPRDVATVVRRNPEALAVVLTRSEVALLTGEPPPDRESLAVEGGRLRRIVPCDWESPEILETEASELVLEDLVRAYAAPATRSQKPSVNIFGPPVFGPSALAEYDEVERLMGLLGIEVNARVPLGADPEDLESLPKAWANVLLYREIGESATLFLQDEFKMPRVTTPMIGTGGTGAALKNIGRLCRLDNDRVRRAIWAELSRTAHLPWYARLAPPETFEGRRVFIFGDFTYALGLGHTLTREVGLEVSSCGTYMNHLARDFVFHAETVAEDAFVTDDPENVARRIEESGPDLVIGTHMERDVADSLGIPFLQFCPPVDGRSFAERPLMGYEGSNVLADALEGSLGRVMEKEEAREEFGMSWTEEALEELSEIPAFLRGRAKKLAEETARNEGESEVTREIFLDSRL